ncbi:DNA gyrase inhibitor YacG [Sphingomonas yabuuchiae]|uniref:DNA gyrase inhibitor YacG n=1 Tax=Sphingomonas yabuuchiae TaxID=172044 RepID=UPI000A009E93|nr:DNA gyrase inhibitor YacG [Sphingomonas yabuuchiae]
MTTCPICDKPTAPDHAPFCSRGCKDRDLLQWLGEGYRIPVKENDEEGLDSGESHP